MAQFYAANLWSACFFIGDPTNIIAAQAYNLNFVTYLELSGLPTLVAGLSCILLTYLYYRNDIPVTFERPEVDSWSCLKDKFVSVSQCERLAHDDDNNDYVPYRVLFSVERW